MNWLFLEHTFSLVKTEVLLKQLGFARGAKAAGMQQRWGQTEAQAN